MQQGEGQGVSGTCEDGLPVWNAATNISSPSNSRCSVGTDCEDCGHRYLCTSCPSECAARIVDRYDAITGELQNAEFCLEDMWLDTRTCYAACNNRECGHQHCTVAEASVKCIREQKPWAFLFGRVPATFDATTLQTTPSTSSTATAPLLALMTVGQGVIEPAEGGPPQMAVGFEFTLTLQWQDSRLFQSPCYEVSPRCLSYDLPGMNPFHRSRSRCQAVPLRCTRLALGCSRRPRLPSSSAGPSFSR